MKSASRTLVMSPPELWELIDQPDRMQGLMCGLLGRATEVTVNEREPESVLRWEASDNGADAWIEVQLAEKGWGTNVKLKAENGGEATKLEGWLDAVLDELATPQKRPFEGMDAPPPEPAQDPTPAPAEEPKVKPVAEEAAAEPEPPAPVEESVAPPKNPEQERPGKLRRLLGL
jgi:outer membrane biosynthesis protein TonB